MTKAEKNTIIRRAIGFYGEEHQVYKLFEELGELTTEIARGQNGVDNRIALVGELADVYIMLGQLRTMVGVSDEEVEDCISFKLGRLTGRMDAEEMFARADDAL